VLTEDSKFSCEYLINYLMKMLIQRD